MFDVHKEIEMAPENPHRGWCGWLGSATQIKLEEVIPKSSKSAHLCFCIHKKTESAGTIHAEEKVYGPGELVAMSCGPRRFPAASTSMMIYTDEHEHLRAEVTWYQHQPGVFREGEGER